MRSVRLSVAMSLDGYIADPKGGYDWIVIDPEIDFGEMFKGYDAVLMGRSFSTRIPTLRGFEAHDLQVNARAMAPPYKYLYTCSE